MSTFNVKNSLLALGFAMASLAANASTVELVFDVAAQSRILGHLDTATSSWIDSQDASFVPQHFDLTVRFHLDSPSVEPVQSTSSNGSSVLSGMTTYDDNDWPFTPNSPTPYTADMLAWASLQTMANLLPSAAWQSQSTPYVADPSSLQPVSAQAGFDTSVSMPLYSGDLHELWTYGRSVTLNLTAQSIPNSEFGNWTADDFLSHLRAQIGVVNANAFSETAYKSVLISQFPPNAENRIQIIGDVELLSVNVVPEPATYMLTGLGLVGIWAVRRRHLSAR
ncbi:MAG: PEP-CTERM sorting domain-containing protein [Aquabacterium sp.]